MNPSTAMPTTANSSLDPLAQLADIHLPAEVASFPWAPGWWLLLVLAITLTATLTYWLIKRHQNRAWLRIALAELQQIDTFKPDCDAQLAKQLNQLLRRVAIHQHPKETAGLSGEKWINFLVSNSKDKAQAQQIFSHLVFTSYSATQTIEDKTQLFQFCRKWIIAQQGRSMSHRPADV
ncbi:DUF4381 domain-containing protein [Spongiibacter sp. KMU-158]|uniref:DUF4381 domain-containing protein n=1 Tax=Spongiibacter pelagi TaxID=2760804 RepID=A0A927BZQ5_9GAMM|nr:DUF4381 domain-containing protein [Spongiibacter pelagi]MBD2858039.1 DUF4381 domain-containing protein [Spongiibacter pelagi]